ncbi:FecR family protein [Pseudomonas kurunegalensis]|uniref:FecR family protein n=1 Tax=Pseudomonas kurunegalensis TaxID=485880 RepID=UPI002570CCBF|nr:FecR domain-containing protein [Pseudomonas kurunegalensis]WJD64632.1 FecR domain-containing protein [Pseudomonas kurunegalensis]
MIASERPDHATLQAAANWYAQLLAAPQDAQLQRRWQQWLGAASANQVAWAHVERISQRFTPLKLQADASLQALGRVRRTDLDRRRAVGLLGLLCGGGLLALAGWRVPAARQQLLVLNADQRTATGEIRSLRLPDGGLVWLNGSTALNIDYRANLRRVELLAGEVLVETAHDSRPFVIDTHQGRLQALGTRFSVWQRDQSARLSVFDGAVRLHPAEGTDSLVVAAGWQSDFDRHGAQAPRAVDESRQAWREGRLLASDISLGEFVEQLRAYLPGHLGVDPHVRALRVMGSFPADDPERTLAMLESALPIRVRKTLPWWYSIEPR